MAHRVCSRVAAEIDGVASGIVIDALAHPETAASAVETTTMVAAPISAMVAAMVIAGAPIDAAAIIAAAVIAAPPTIPAAVISAAVIPAAIVGIAAIVVRIAAVAIAWIDGRVATDERDGERCNGRA
jgi:hypothetical protein